MDKKNNFKSKSKIANICTLFFWPCLQFYDILNILSVYQFTPVFSWTGWCGSKNEVYLQNKMIYVATVKTVVKTRKKLNNQSFTWYYQTHCFDVLVKINILTFLAHYIMIQSSIQTFQIWLWHYEKRFNKSTVQTT